MEYYNALPSILVCSTSNLAGANRIILKIFMYIVHDTSYMEYDTNDFPGLYIGMGDIIIDGKKIAECIFSLEILIGGSKPLEAEGGFVEFNKGKLPFDESKKEFFLSMDGVISRDHEYYVTKFSCFTNTSLYPKFIVPKPMQILENISESGTEESSE